jgi:hypothetical protein
MFMTTHFADTLAQLVVTQADQVGNPIASSSALTFSISARITLVSANATASWGSKSSSAGSKLPI